MAALAQAQVEGTQDALRRSLRHLLAQQRDPGCWEGEMVWCTMILSQYVITRRLCEFVAGPIDERTRARMIHHYETARTADGAFGLHGESAGYLFTTTLAYVALRLLGLPPQHPLPAGALAWIHRQPGGVASIPTWGKLWLALCGLYGWEGVNPTPPELFLLPRALPVHPVRFYCHTRLIYLGIAYLYGRRFVGTLGPLRDALREELYPRGYGAVDFAAQRHNLAASDLYVRPSRALRACYDVLAVYERRASRRLRERALDGCYQRILYELRQSRYQCISPVNGLLHCLALLDRGDTAELSRALAAMEAWRWEDEAEGVRYVGAHSTAWDTAFAMQAVLAGPPGLRREAAPALLRAYRWLDATQLREELPQGAREGRDAALGGWCFSDGQHRWPVSDCTAEALSAVLGMHRAGLVPAGERISEGNLRSAAEFIMQRQNPDGGFGSYERRRGSLLLEAINPSEMYGSCMTERSYVECTASCVEGLAHFRAALPGALEPRLSEALRRGVLRLRAQQRADGSFPGFWGVNFTYGIFHAVKALRAAGTQVEDPALQAAARWLVTHQRADGSWGEHYQSMLSGEYREHPEGQVIMSAWALHALQDLLPGDAEPLLRGLCWLRAQQRADGSFPRQAQAGVFFGTAMLDYRLYKAYFPLWVLARAEGGR